MFSTRFDNLPSQKPVTIAEYIWVNGSNVDLRSKTVLIHRICSTLEDFPASEISPCKSEEKSLGIYLKPIYFCPDPFRINPSDKNQRAYLVLCESFNIEDISNIDSSSREVCNSILQEQTVKDQDPVFMWQQQYVLMETIGTTYKKPLAFPKGGFACPQLKEDGIQKYIFGVGSSTSFGRYVAEAHMKACLAAGIELSGINADEFPGQWEFRIGPIAGIQGMDQLWVARYILVRICEGFGIGVSFEPKPVKGDWSGSGCHTTISTASSRQEGGYEKLIEYLSELDKHHENHLSLYGTLAIGKKMSYEQFSYKIGNRDCSVRIPLRCVKEKKGFIEDRRPSSDCDPYLVGGILLDTVLLKGKFVKKLMDFSQEI